MLTTKNALSQGADCNTADPFCTGTTYTFPSSTSTTAPVGPNYGCLGSEPNPAFYYLQIATSGTLVVNISQTDASGSAADVDFICWGPFTSPSAGCASGLTGSAVDCSYSASATETCTIPSAVAGQFYILMMTNFAGVPANITAASDPSSTATTNCTILCNMTGITTVVGACNPATNTYGLTGVISYTTPPATGTLTITNSCSGASQVFNPPFGATSTSYSLTGLPANGAGCTVTAIFSADSLCTFTQTFTAAPSCSVTCNISGITTVPTACNPPTQQYDISGNVSFINAPATGTLTITNSCGGTPVVLNAPFTSPAAYTFTGLPANSSSCNITAVFSADATCTFTQAYTAPAPCPIICSISSVTATPSACDPATNSYSVAGNVTFVNPPATGTLTVTSSCGGTIQTLNAPFVSPLAYSLTGLTSNGASCSVTAVFSADATCTFTQNYTAPPSCTLCPVTATNSGPLCAGQTLNLTATTVAGATYSWTGPAGFSSTLQNPVITNVTPAMAGNYVVTLSTTAPPCSSSSTTTFVVNPVPTITTSGDVSVYIGNPALIYAAGGVNYTWNPGTSLSCSTCDSTFASPSQTTVYCVTVANAAGCIDSACITVKIQLPCPSNRTMSMPNAFSPNGDGVNDQFCLEGWSDCISEFEILIFDRWGAKIYESKDPGFCWDGIYHGKLLDPAVYVYFIKATYETEGSSPAAPKGKIDVTKKGNISLVR
ncbi:MAG: T9SS type B sorting domain-containing protein [Bacteroidia bacterium]